MTLQLSDQVIHTSSPLLISQLAKQAAGESLFLGEVVFECQQQSDSDPSVDHFPTAANTMGVG
ncbi:hypothetical protein C6C11_06740 [Aeromonas hydrophila]|uniref:Uncharacterized protein n=1 Tax=Aeromonas hydrophila TaxID=644 RepID=A0ABD7GAR6_AERHY|nr:hypothetical protein C2U40_06080 [Aeromonas sp. ASNIH4]POU36306.1 hypothetical protein C3405_17035 [Aeromonas hydrophila]POV86923.1 hypothetical protein C3395_18185 [Aeromonas sp. ASNIH6]RCF51125.1 hypothetical protein C6C11_06740 [Aeromonas hydrophila]